MWTLSLFLEVCCIINWIPKDIMMLTLSSRTVLAFIIMTTFGTISEGKVVMMTTLDFQLALWVRAAPVILYHIRANPVALWLSCSTDLARSNQDGRGDHDDGGGGGGGRSRSDGEPSGNSRCEELFWKADIFCDCGALCADGGWSGRNRDTSVNPRCEKLFW